jgi:hypothetical protein
MADLSQQPLSAKINHYFQHRPERERVLFEKLRQMLSLPAIVARRSMARALAPSAPFTIDDERGFTVFEPGTFAEAAEIAATTRDLGHTVDLQRPGLSKKARSGFMVPLVDPATLTLDSPFLRMALRPDVIAAVSAYLGMVPVLAHLNVYYSGETQDQARQSQLFHCDADATRQVKIFVLCSEVTPAHGPLTLLDARMSADVRRSLKYSFGKKIKDPLVLRGANAAAMHPILGSPGTVCFVDTTRCFHFGSRVEKGASPRLLTVIQYLTPASFMLPRDHRKGAPFRHLATAGLSRAQRMVLGAE